MIERSLHPTAAAALEVIYQHRLLATSQLHQILAPSHRVRWVQRLLAVLEGRGLADAVAAHPRRTGRAERLWYVTERGAEVVEAVHNRTETRRRLLTAQVAGGQLQAHTLAVNDVGIAFLRAARERGHDFGALSWQHEVAHQLNPGRRYPDLLVADAVLRYWTASLGGETALHYRFLELDRANLLMDDLVAKLARYARLYRLWTEQLRTAAGGSETVAWPALYRAFPNVLVILANPGRANLRRRMETVRALCHAEPELRRCPPLSISFTVFEDLTAWGPFAPIFRRPGDDQLFNWLGQPAGDVGSDHAAASVGPVGPMTREEGR
jgi:Replication-relaxation